MKNGRHYGYGYRHLGGFDGWMDSISKFGQAAVETAAPTVGKIVEREQNRLIDKALGVKRRGGTGTVIVRQESAARGINNTMLYIGAGLVAAGILFFALKK